MVVSGGDRPTMPAKAAGQAQPWADVWVGRDYRIQEHALGGEHRLLDAHDVRRASGSLEHCRWVFERLAPPVRDEAPEELTILLHGIGHTRPSTIALSRALRAAGVVTTALSYASSRQSLAAHAAALESVLVALDEATTRVSFVTHRPGAAIVRHLLERRGPWSARREPHRIVVVAPPRIEGLVPSAHDGIVPAAETELERLAARADPEGFDAALLDAREALAAVVRFLTSEVPSFA